MHLLQPILNEARKPKFHDKTDVYLTMKPCRDFKKVIIKNPIKHKLAVGRGTFSDVPWKCHYCNVSQTRRDTDTDTLGLETFFHERRPLSQNLSLFSDNGHSTFQQSSTNQNLADIFSHEAGLTNTIKTNFCECCVQSSE